MFAVLPAAYPQLLVTMAGQLLALRYRLARAALASTPVSAGPPPRSKRNRDARGRFTRVVLAAPSQPVADPIAWWFPGSGRSLGAAERQALVRALVAWVRDDHRAYARLSFDDLLPPALDANS